MIYRELAQRSCEEACAETLHRDLLQRSCQEVPCRDLARRALIEISYKNLARRPLTETLVQRLGEEKGDLAQRSFKGGLNRDLTLRSFTEIFCGDPT